jgi:demethylmenaquinone methyltransferase/2-methoxy-6-polyprenyl-1,4-benzoquinol methylase
MRNHQIFFNNAAKNWDKKYYNPELKIFLKQFVKKFGLDNCENILDVGTGTGILIPFLVEFLDPKGQITAIDYAKSMVNIWKNKYDKFSNVSITIADVDNLPFSEASFNAITCFGLFPHLENKKDSLQEFNRVLKSKGKLIISHALSRRELRNMHMNTNSVVTNDVLPNKNEMCNLLNLTDFTQIQIIDKKGSYLCISTKK